MPARSSKLSLVALGALVSGMLAAAPVAANDIAQIKTLTGTVIIERGAERLLGAVGTRMQQADVVRTGIDGSVGITFTDNTLISAGPNSIVVLAMAALVLWHGGSFTSGTTQGIEAAIVQEVLGRELAYPGDSSFIIVFRSRDLEWRDPRYKDALGAALWVGVWGLGAYLLDKNFHAFAMGFRHISPYSWAATLLALLSLGIYLFHRNHNRKAG